MSTNITLLGNFRVQDSNGGAVAVPAKKVQALIAVLALAHPREVNRERLLDLLWGDSDRGLARQSLRQALTTAKRSVGGVLRADRDLLSLDMDRCNVDLVAFLELSNADDIRSLHDAIEHYQGPLLEGLSISEDEFDHWLNVERARLSKLATETMLRLRDLYLAEGNHAAAVSILQRLLELDPACEEAHRSLMRTFEATGQRSVALQQYQTCRQALKWHLDAEPSPETKALYDEIRRRSSPARTAAGNVLQRIQAISIAVLPFALRKRSAEIDAMATTIPDGLSTQLSRLSGVQVIAPALAEAAVAESSGDLRGVADDLGARYLITGGLRDTAAGSARLSLQLLGGWDAHYLWGMQEDIPLQTTHDELDELVAAVAAKVDQQLNLAELKFGADSPEDSRSKMRQATAILYSRGWFDDAVLSALELLNDALTADPNFALARAYRAFVVAFAWKLGIVENAKWLSEAYADAELAAAQAPSNSEVLGYAGCALARLGEPHRSESLLSRAIEENSGNAQAWAALGSTQLALGRNEVGIESLQRGLRISPMDYRRSVWLAALAGGLARAGKTEESLEAARAACSSDARFYPARLALAVALLKLGNEAEAIHAINETFRIQPQLSAETARDWIGQRGFARLSPLWPKHSARQSDAPAMRRRFSDRPHLAIVN